MIYQVYQVNPGVFGECRAGGGGGYFVHNRCANRDSHSSRDFIEKRRACVVVGGWVSTLFLLCEGVYFLEHNSCVRLLDRWKHRNTRKKYSTAWTVKSTGSGGWGGRCKIFDGIV